MLHQSYVLAQGPVSLTGPMLAPLEPLVLGFVFKSLVSVL